MSAPRAAEEPEPLDLIAPGIYLCGEGLTRAATGRRPAPSEVAMARAYIRTKCTPSMQLTVSSYGAKHLAEESAGAYISNGAFIAGCIAEGIAWAPGDMRRGLEVNAALGLKLPKVKRPRPPVVYRGSR